MVVDFSIIHSRSTTFCDVSPSARRRAQRRCQHGSRSCLPVHPRDPRPAPRGSRRWSAAPTRRPARRCGSREAWPTWRRRGRAAASAAAFAALTAAFASAAAACAAAFAAGSSLTRALTRRGASCTSSSFVKVSVWRPAGAARASASTRPLVRAFGDSIGTFFLGAFFSSEPLVASKFGAARRVEAERELRWARCDHARPGPPRREGGLST
jgi:hypothetical protein